MYRRDPAVKPLIATIQIEKPGAKTTEAVGADDNVACRAEMP
jgi:hypothetical protein